LRFRSQYTIPISIILHILLLLLFGILREFDLWATDVVENNVEETPLVFEFEQPRRNEVVETPEDAEIAEPPKDAEYASDKNARARNPETDSDLALGDPFASGDLDVPELPTPRGQKGEPLPETQQPNKSNEETSPEEEMEEEGDRYVNNSNRAFRDYLTNPKQTDRSGVPESSQRARYDNQDSRSEDMGSLSFNTYDWDFAPYMLALKKKIEGNIFPPPAFTRLGMIDGETLLRFRIHPNGKMGELAVLEYTGHHTLKETSVRAVEVSDPFPKLPSDFPEEYLEVTARFSYFIQSRKDRQ